MTDREMLELAAKAIGLHGVDGVYPIASDSSGDWHEWNPLLDDGDALRLAVKLGLSLHAFPHHHQGAQVVATYTRHAIEAREYADSSGDDLCAATRRAITRAAAEIGKSMEAADG